MREVWKDINGYEGLYQISNLGRVKKVKNNRIVSTFSTSGYLRITINKKHYSIHRLVAEAFIPNPDNLPEVNHIDKNKQNNCVSNLEWCTRFYNMQHCKSKIVEQYDLNNNLIASYYGLGEASRETKINASHICSCCKGKRKTTGKFKWKYKD